MKSRMKLTQDEIKEAIKKYITDLDSNPLFYDLSEIRRLNDAKTLERISDKFNRFYQTSKAKSFEIPYNQIINRTVITPEVEDIVIRYILMNRLQKRTNYLPSTEQFDDFSIGEFSKEEIEKGNSIFIKVDVLDCYESINHEYIEQAILGVMKDDTLFIDVFKNCLQLVFENDQGEILKKEKGLLIGSKPDEYFAEYYLDLIREEIEDLGINIFRIADEFIFFAKNVSIARNNYKLVEGVIAKYGLIVNKSKTLISDYRELILEPKIDISLEISRKVVASTPVTITAFGLRSKNEGDAINKTYLHGETPINSEDSDIEDAELVDIEIDSYDNAITFLKYLVTSQKAVLEYQNKHPKFKYLYNVVFSQPTDFRDDYYNLDTSILSVRNIEKLRKVIFYYPRSEYYTALAIQLLVFAATNSVHCANLDTYDGLDGLKYSLTRTCELSNITIIEVLESSDIHAYQKYLLLRYLFKRKGSLSLSFENYTIITRHSSVQNDLLGVKTSLPFKTEVLRLVQDIAVESDYYPLLSITNELSKTKN